MGKDSLVKEITFEIKFDGDTRYTPVKLPYKKRDRLSVIELHWEDNNSWNLVQIKDEYYDVQVFANEKEGKFINDEGLVCYDYHPTMNSKLQVQLCRMELEADGETLGHTDEWIYDGEGCKIRNVKVKTY